MHGNTISRAAAELGGGVGASPTGYFVISSKPCLLGGARDPQTARKGNPVAKIGRVDVRVVGDAAWIGTHQVGCKLVPSGCDDGTARALPQEAIDDEGALHVIGLVIGPSEVPGCVEALVSRGLTGDTALPQVLTRLRMLAPRVARLEHALASVLALSAHDLPDGLATWLARSAGPPRMTAGQQQSMAELPKDAFDTLLRSTDRLSIAGTLLVMLGWAVSIDEDEEGAGSAAVSRGQDDKEAKARGIFAKLGEENRGYQGKLFQLMRKLPWPRVEELADVAVSMASASVEDGQRLHSPGMLSLRGATPPAVPTSVSSAVT